MAIHTDDVVISNTPLPIQGGNSTPVVVSGTVTTSSGASNSASITQVVLTTNANSTLLSANANRKGVVIFIPLATTYIKFGSTASSSSFTFQTTVPNTTIERSDWLGQIDALSTSGQTITITELS